MVPPMPLWVKVPNGRWNIARRKVRALTLTAVILGIGFLVAGSTKPLEVEPVAPTTSSRT